MTDIQISQDTCIHCAKCCRVCPVFIFNQEEKNGVVSVKNADKCLVCGHCMDVCPTGSIRHSEIPREKVHPIRYDMMPSPDQLMELIHARRSNRTMTSRPIAADQMARIVEAARYAPTAENKRQVSITVIQDADKLRQIIEFTFSTFESIAKKLQNPLVKLLVKPRHPEYYDLIPTLHDMEARYGRGEDPILRHASAVIAFTTPKDAFGEKDSNLAYQNASLMAQALGISQLYLGFVCVAAQRGDTAHFKRILGVEGEIHALMGLGIPAFRYTNYTER
jgi:nitroreductase/NAD-dependent dihydropyrimidine dehydrogenase PreA subunit